EVGGLPVERRPMRQWMLRITAYADRLANDLDLVDWPESLKEMQRNWIGKSVGAEVDFELAESPNDEAEVITVFTTRPDTLYGATYMVLAPEHALVDKITTPTQKKAVAEYRAAVAARSERDRMAEAKEKTGVFTGVLDEQGNAYPLDESELPLTLPELADFKPTGTPEPPLSKAKEWIRYTNKAGESFTRETNTMPQWAGSCWYYLRYIDPKNHQRFVDPGKEKYWMPVDLYVGGAEHAVLHLLYSRFWHKILFDLGHVCSPAPFMKLVNHG